MAQTAYRIDTKTGRKALTPRREPYFHKLGARRYLGFRKTQTGGAWVARVTVEKSGEKKFQRIADESEMEFNDAVKAATAWFDDVGKKAEQGADIHYTLRDAIEDYCAHKKVANSEKSANDTRGRLLKHLPDSLLNTEIVKLSTIALKRWRDGMVKDDDDPEVVRRSKDTVNRRLNDFKAALNLAWRNGLAADDTAWRRVEGFKGVSKGRTLFLTEEQVSALLDAAPNDAVRNVIKAGVLTGARRGELFALRVRDFDPAEGTVSVTADQTGAKKTGARVIYLSDSGVAFFKKLAKRKKAGDYLLQSPSGGQWPEDDLTRPFKTAVEQAGLPVETCFYSLRHYHISRALLAGVQPQVVAENCGTSLRMIEKHYGKFLATDRRAMFNQVAL